MFSFFVSKQIIVPNRSSNAVCIRYGADSYFDNSSLPNSRENRSITSFSARFQFEGRYSRLFLFFSFSSLFSIRNKSDAQTTATERGPAILLFFGRAVPFRYGRSETKRNAVNRREPFRFSSARPTKCDRVLRRPKGRSYETVSPGKVESRNPAHAALFLATDRVFATINAGARNVPGRERATVAPVVSPAAHRRASDVPLLSGTTQFPLNVKQRHKPRADNAVQRLRTLNGKHSNVITNGRGVYANVPGEVRDTLNGSPGTGDFRGIPFRRNGGAGATDRSTKSERFEWFDIKRDLYARGVRHSDVTSAILKCKIICFVRYYYRHIRGFIYIYLSRRDQ